jgi:enamine deaminase RidA (YjgF/YER057c/UK114 family)
MTRHATDRSNGNALTLMNPTGLYDPAPNGYSHVALVAAGARLVYVAGQGGETESGALAADFRLQVRQALRNLATALAVSGARVTDIAKLTVLIVDHSEQRLHIFGEELMEALGEGMKPACTLIPVPRLALDGMLFEVEAVAVLPA